MERKKLVVAANNMDTFVVKMTDQLMKITQLCAHGIARTGQDLLSVAGPVITSQSCIDTQKPSTSSAGPMQNSSRSQDEGQNQAGMTEMKTKYNNDYF